MEKVGEGGSKVGLGALVGRSRSAAKKVLQLSLHALHLRLGLVLALLSLLCLMPRRESDRVASKKSVNKCGGPRSDQTEKTHRQRTPDLAREDAQLAVRKVEQDLVDLCVGLLLELVLVLVEAVERLIHHLLHDTRLQPQSKTETTRRQCRNARKSRVR